MITHGNSNNMQKHPYLALDNVSLVLNFSDTQGTEFPPVFVLGIKK